MPHSLVNLLLLLTLSGAFARSHGHNQQKRQQAATNYATDISATNTIVLAAEPANLTFAPCTAIGPRKVNATLGLLCANLSVPIDDADPALGTVQLGIAKLPAKPGPGQQRIGNLFVNPGGPGASAATMVLQFAARALPMGAAVLAQFDLVGMDPRGVGLSSPQRCDMSVGNLPTTGFFDAATTPEGFRQLFDYNKKLGETCRAMTGPLFDRMDTVAVAKDLEKVRVAMGDEPMNFFGQSYGSQLGAQYAALYPDKVRAMALDGIMQHSGGFASNVLIQATAVDQAIQEFFRECDATPQNCGLPPGGQANNSSSSSNSSVPHDMRAIWKSVIDQAAAGTLKAPGCDGTPKTGCFPNITVSNVLGVARALIEVPPRHRMLGQGLLLASQGNGTLFPDELLSGDAFRDSSQYAIQNVQCQDGHFVAASGPAEVQRLAALTRTFTVTPGMGEFWTRVITCTGYPVRVSNPRRPLAVNATKNPVLLVQSRFDPATSFVYAQGMREEIDKSVLLVRDGLSHTSYFIQGETARMMDGYWVNLTVPSEGTVTKT